MGSSAQSLFNNNAVTTIAANGYNGGSATSDAPSSGTSETWTVTSSSSFPAASSSATPPTQFSIADPAQPGELIWVTNVSGTTWTVTRGAEGTTTAVHAAGAQFYGLASGGDLDSMLQKIGLISNNTGLQLASQSSAPTTTESVYYVNANGSPTFRNGSAGYSGQLVNSMTSTPTSLTANSGTATAVTNTFTIPANDAAAGTVYLLKAWGYGTYSSGTTQWWQLAVNGSTYGETLYSALPATFLWEAESELAIVTSGASGTAYLKTRVLVSETGTPANASPNVVIGANGAATPSTITLATTSSFTLAIKCAMNGTSSIIGLVSYLQRIGT